MLNALFNIFSLSNTMFSIPRIKAVGPDDDGSPQVQAGFGPAQNLSSGFDE